MKIRTPTIANRVLGALVVSLLVAVLFSYMRGGFDTKPFIVFVVATFVGSIIWQFLFRKETLFLIEKTLQRLPFHSFIRYVLLAGIFIWLIIWSGPTIASGGFGGWLIAILIWLVAPVIVCLIAPRYPILFGILATGCTIFSGWVEDSRLYSDSRDIQWSHVFSQPMEFFIGWCVAGALSLIVSIPVYLNRRTSLNSAALKN